MVLASEMGCGPSVQGGPGAAGFLQLGEDEPGRHTVVPLDAVLRPEN